MPLPARATAHADKQLRPRLAERLVGDTETGDARGDSATRPASLAEVDDRFASRWPRSHLASVAIHLGVATAALTETVASGVPLPGAAALLGAALLGLLVCRLAFDVLPCPGSLQRIALPTVVAGAATLGALTLVGSAWLLGTHPSVREAGYAVLSALSVLAIATAAHGFELRYGKRTRRVFLIGTQSQQRELAREIQHRADLSLVGWLPVGATTITLDLDQATAAIARVAPSILVLSDEAIRDPRLVALASQLNLAGIRVRELRGFYEQEFEKVAVSELSASWFLFDIAGIHDARLYRLIKRSLETLIASLVLLLALPVLPLIVLGIRIASPGPVLFRQPRTGKNGRPLMLTKFRTMHPASASEHGSWAVGLGGRIFPFGRFLRRFRLDEIPQLLQVVCGELSLVGPRPEQPTIVEHLEKQMRYYAARHCVRPGLTGWAQVNYGYGGSDDGALTKLQYDLFYVKRQSLGLDLRIVAATVRTILRGRG